MKTAESLLTSPAALLRDRLWTPKDGALQARYDELSTQVFAFDQSTLEETDDNESVGGQKRMSGSVQLEDPTWADLTDLLPGDAVVSRAVSDHRLS